jgi:hypothetical protein
MNPISFLQREIATALRPFVGLDLVSAGRAANLQYFTFGRHSTAPETTEDLAEFEIHILCPWRLVIDGDIMMGSADYYRPATEYVSDDEFNAATIGSRVIDQRNEDLRERIDRRRYTVSSFDVNPGGFRLSISPAALLEVFPDASSAAHSELEFWRVFQPHLAAPHFVVSSAGIDRVAEA